MRLILKFKHEESVYHSHAGSSFTTTISPFNARHLFLTPWKFKIVTRLHSTVKPHLTKDILTIVCSTDVSILVILRVDSEDPLHHLPCSKVSWYLYAPLNIISIFSQHSTESQHWVFLCQTNLSPKVDYTYSIGYP